MYTYTIRMYTSALSWAGTNANVNLTLYGTEGESQEQIFENDLKTTFKSGAKDIFTVDAGQSLGKLTKVRVGHDNTGHLPGWKLVKIEIEDDVTGKGIGFDCFEWFDLESGDGKIQRELHPTGDFKAKTYSYKVLFHTGDVSFAGTDANIYFTLFGTKGDTGEIKIENKGSTTFENGMIDKCDVEKRLPLGTLTKIRVRHDNTGIGPGWFLDKITVLDVFNDHTVVFPCHRWLSADADDGMIERQLIGDDFERRDKEVKNREKIEQEEEDRKRREEEERRMREEEERKRREREQIEKFENDKKRKEEERRQRIEENRRKREEVEMRRNREISDVIDTHTERERKRSESEDKRKREKIERKEKEILRKEIEKKDKRHKNNEIGKDDKFNKPEDQKIKEQQDEKIQDDEKLLKEVEKQRERLRRLKNIEKRRRDEEKRKNEEENRRRKEENRRKDEERRREEEENRRKKEENRRQEEETRRKREESQRQDKAKLKNEVSYEDEEKLKKEEEERRIEEDKVRNDEDNRRKEEDKVREEEEKRREQEDKRRREEDARRKQEDDLRNKEEKEIDEEFNSEFLYKISFYTGSKWFAGTDANIYVTIYGTKRDSGQITFYNKGTTTFEAGMIDSQYVKTKFPLGTLTKVHVTHDNKGWLPGWYLNKIVVQDTLNNHTVVFPCGRWLKGGEIIADDFEKRDEQAKAKDKEEQRRKQEEKQRQKDDKKRKQAEDERQENERKRQEAEKRRKEEERKRQAAEQQRKEEERKRQEAEKNREQQREMRTYKVYLFTEDAFGAWTGTDILIVLYGSEGESTEHVINSDGSYSYGGGMKGTLDIECPRHLGTLTHIKIGPDNDAWASPWFLVAVEDPQTDDVVVFTCNRSPSMEKLHSPHIYYPSHTNDVEDLLAMESDTTEDWKLVKKTKKAQIFRKKAPEKELAQPTVKADLRLQGIPYQKAVEYFTDWEIRQRWDKTFGVVDILEKIGKFKVIYCSNKMPTFCKRREMVLACLDHPEQQYHVQIMCSILHPMVPQSLKTNKIRANTSTFGLVIRPMDDDTQSSNVTVITQIDLKGSAPKFIKNGYLENSPIKWIKMLKRYHKKHGHEEGVGTVKDTDSLNNNVENITG